MRGEQQVLGIWQVAAAVALACDLLIMMLIHGHFSALLVPAHHEPFPPCKCRGNDKLTALLQM
jgi:hypothetical protein